jgi:hypothetical protein
MAKKKDENQIAFSSLEELLKRDAERDGLPISPILPEKKNAKAAAAGKLGGLKGGKARAEKLSSKKKREIAQKAAKARWSSKK